jgi:hypothetical protein
MKKDPWTTSDTIASLLLAPVVFGNTALRGWAIAKLWGWFVVPLGFGEIGIVEAVGLSTLISLLTARYSKEPERPGDTLLQQLAMSAIYGVFISLGSVLAGWVARCFI